MDALRAQVSMLQARLDRAEAGSRIDSCGLRHEQPALDSTPVSALSLEQLLAKRKRDYFPESLEMAVEKVSIEEGTQPVGSFKYLCMVYPGDIDLYERLFFPMTDRWNAAERAARRLQLIARRVMLAEDEGRMFFADFKAGYDRRLFLLSSDGSSPSAGTYPPPVEDFDATAFESKLATAVATGVLDAKAAAEVRGLSAAVVSARNGNDETRCKHAWIELAEAVRRL